MPNAYNQPFSKTPGASGKIYTKGNGNPYEQFGADNNQTAVAEQRESTKAEVARQIDQQRQEKQQQAQQQVQQAKQSAWSKAGRIVTAPGRAIANQLYKPLEKEQNRASDLAAEQVKQGFADTTPSEAAQNTKQVAHDTSLQTKAADFGKNVISPITQLGKTVAYVNGGANYLDKATHKASDALDAVESKVRSDFKSGKMSKPEYQTAIQKLADARSKLSGAAAKNTQDVTENTNPVRTAADVAQIASMFVGGGEAKSLATGAEGVIKGGLKNIAAGAAGNVASTLGTDPHATAKDIGKSAAIGGGIGLAATGASALVGKAGEALKPGDLSAEKSAVFNQVAERAKGQLKPPGQTPPPSGLKPLGQQELESRAQAMTAATQPAPGAATGRTAPPSTGTATSKVASSIEARSIENKLTKGFDGLAGFDPTTVKEQAGLATDLLSTDLERAKRMMNGTEALPEKLRGATLITALEEHATKTKDGQLLIDLARSPLASETSKHAQELRMLAERNPESAVGAIKQVAAVKAKAIESRMGMTVDAAVKKTAEEIKASIKKPTKMNWSQFTESIACK